MKKLAVTLGVLAVLATGCGGSDAPAASDKAAVDESSASTPTPTPTPTPSAPVATLREICPQVESGLPRGMIPKYPALKDFATTLRLLRNGGDLEAQNALDLLIDPVNSLETEVQYNSQGQVLNQALSDYLDGISAFADRCKAAGSSALQ